METVLVRKSLKPEEALKRVAKKVIIGVKERDPIAKRNVLQGVFRTYLFGEKGKDTIKKLLFVMNRDTILYSDSA